MFGDAWYLQDDYGAWNGDRQPNVVDVLELTGTVIEEDGNTRLVNVELVKFVDF